MSDYNWFQEIHPVESLEERFDFVEDDELRKNITICFQYIIFLVTVDVEVSPSGPIRYSLYRDVVIHTASIIESSLNHCLKKLFEKGEVKSTEVMPAEWKVTNIHPIYKINEDEKIIHGINKRAISQLRDNTQMKDIIKAAKKAGVLNEDLETKVDTIRERRNSIHLAGKESKDIYPEKEEIDEMFEHAKETLDAIETKLSS